MKVLQVTDTHVGPAGHVGYGVDPRARLEECVADINLHHADASLCLLTGDLVNTGARAEYENLVSVVRQLKVPVRVLPGNHDDRGLLREFFPDTPVDEHGFLQSAFPVPGGRLLLLDTLRVDKASGELCERRLAWLARELARAGDTMILAMHHPPLAVGIEFMDRIALADAERFWATLAPHRARIRLLVFGHVHRPVTGVSHGIPFAGCPSTAQQVALELGPQPELHLNFNHEPPCYAILDVREDEVIVHQQRYQQNLSPAFPRQGKRKD